MPGPMNRAPRGVKPTVENPGKIFLRLMKLVIKGNVLKWIFIAVCIFLSVQATVQGMLFTQTLIDKHIVWYGMPPSDAERQILLPYFAIR